MDRFLIEDNSPPEFYTDRKGVQKRTHHKYFTLRYRAKCSMTGARTKFYPTKEQALIAIKKRVAHG